MNSNLPRGRSPDPDSDYSHVQLQIPKQLHWEFRQLLFQNHVSVRDIGEDMVRMYMERVQSEGFEKPTTTKKRRKRVATNYKMPSRPEPLDVETIELERDVVLEEVG